MAQVYFWAVIMAYLLFASIFITVKSVQKKINENNGVFSVDLLFGDSFFFTLILSMASTWLLYLVASILFLDPWHMITSFIQYLLLTPTYLNILNVYAFCNTHDITWGTKGDDKPEKLPAANLKPGGKVDVAIPTDDADLNTQYETELRVFSTKYAVPPKNISPEQKHEDYYKGFRSAVVLAWMFCNLALAAIVLNAGGTGDLDGKADNATDEDAEETKRSTIYMAVVLYSVAGLAAVRFVGCCWFLVTRIFRGV
jgi:chitin synthase